MAQRINENRPAGMYRGQRPPRGPRSGDVGQNPMYRPQSLQPNERDITLMDIRRLGAGVDNLVEDIRNLFRGQVDTPGIRSDVINEFGVKDINDDTFPRDLVQLFFDDITNGKRLQFRATLSNITEAHLPEWIQHNYIGRPYPIHQYKGVSRSVTFDFKIYAMNKDEMDYIWKKLNYLTSLTHPASYVATEQSAGFMTPPYVELTIGRLFKRTPGFINSLNYTIPEGTTWDLIDELPIGVDINVGFTIIERGPLSSKQIFPDGDAKDDKFEELFYGDQSRTSLGNSIFGDIRGAWFDLRDAWKDFRG